ncbi:unnamed protein product [Brassica oleracea var. botrytis]
MEVAVNRVVAVVVQGVAVAGCKERGAAVQGVAAVAVKDVRTMVVLLHKKVVLGNEQRPNGDTEPVNDNPENRLAIWDLREPKDQYPRRADLKPVSADLGKDDSAKRQTSYTNASAFVMRNQNIRSEVAERVVHMGHRRPPDYNHPACEQLLETRLQDHGAEEKDPTDTD